MAQSAVLWYKRIIFSSRVDEISSIVIHNQTILINKLYMFVLFIKLFIYFYILFITILKTKQTYTIC